MGKDNQRYGTANAGSHRAAQWLVTQDPMMVAADNCCVEVRPSRRRTACRSRMMLIQHGIILGESGIGRAGGGRGLRVRLHRPAAENQGRHRLGNRADGDR